MAKVNRLVSYVTGIATSVFGMVQSAQAQDSIAPSQSVDSVKKEITLSKQLIEEMNDIFNPDGTKDIKTLKIVNNADSIGVKPELAKTVHMVQSISNTEQIILFGDDVDGDRIITKPELRFAAYYNVDKNKLKQTSVLYTAPEMYSVAHLYAKTKDVYHSLNYERYEKLQDWEVVTKKIPETDDDILNPFRKAVPQVKKDNQPK